MIKYKLYDYSKEIIDKSISVTLYKETLYNNKQICMTIPIKGNII